MQIPVKKGQQAYLGSVPITFLEDSMVGVEANSVDHLAELIAGSAGQRLYGGFIEALKHTDTVTRNDSKTGLPYEVDVEVSYGAGGSRVEKEVGDRREVGAAAAGTGKKKATFVSSGLPSRTDFEDSVDVPSQPRTEFVVPPKRFPDEVLTHTDPPRAELVGDSPDRAVPYVGEFTQDGAFTRQPGAKPVGVVDRTGTEGRPAPSPDTPGTRDRQLPAPSETAKSTPDQTAVALAQASKSDSTDEDDSDLEGISDTESNDLPEDFPNRAALEKGGVKTWTDLDGKTAEELSSEDFKGIGPKGADDILAEVKKKKRRDAYRAKRAAK